MTSVKKALEAARQDIATSGSIEFFHAVYRARKAFGSRLRKAANDGITTDLILIILSGSPLSAADRLTLAELLAGELNTMGRPVTPLAERQAYRELLDEARQMKRGLVARGTKSVTAEWEAAAWAAGDPRARGLSADTIKSDLTRRRWASRAVKDRRDRSSEAGKYKSGSVGRLCCLSKSKKTLCDTW